ncbi:MAG: SpoIID/LytB domain-containing protein, partial [Elusimicrobiales bacterium]
MSSGRSLPATPQRRKLLFFAACLLAAVPLSAKERKVKVLLYSVNRPSALTLAPWQGNVFINDALLTAPALIEAKGSLVAVKGFGPAGKYARVDIPGKGAWLSGGTGPKRLYKGLLEITAEKGRLKVLNTLPLEEYIASVVSAEAGDLSQLEAFKAQAVAARTYMLKHTDNHAKEGYNLCDSTHCQFFPGFGAVRPIAQAAADFTRDEVVTYHGVLASTFYHSICGGRTEAMIYVWPFEHKPYLVSVMDGPEKKPYCSIAPGFYWKTRIYLTALTRMARSQKWILPGENIRTMTVLDRGISKRAVTLEFSTENRRVKISATNFYHGVGRRAGWNAIRSTLFNIYSGKDYVVLEGKGNGHGV